MAGLLCAGLSVMALPGASGQTTSSTTSSSTTQVTRPTTTVVDPSTTSSTVSTTTTTTTTAPTTTTTDATSVTTLGTTTTTTRPLGISTTAPGPDPTAGTTTLPVGAATTTTTLPLLGPDTKADDLQVWEMEITQGTQNLDNNMPLVTGRTTMVRAYVKSAKKTVTGVRGILGGWQGQKYLGSVVSSNQPILANTGGGLRVNADDSLYFHVPNGWTADGVTRFTVFVYQATVDFTFDKEKDTKNNFMTEYKRFYPMAPLKIYMPPLHLHANGADNTYNLLEHLGEIVQIVTGLKRLAPVSDFQVVVPQTPLFPPSHDTSEWDIDESNADEAGNRIVPLTTVAAAKAASNLYDDWRWYAMIDPSQPYTAWNKGDPYTVGGSASGGVAQGKMDASYDPDVPWDLGGSGTLAHELGHNGGLSHYLCRGDEAKGGGIDPNYPTPFKNCTMSIPTNSGYWGFDVFYTTFPYIPKPIAISPKPDAVKPNKSSPLMGYAAYGWLDPYSYCKLLIAYGVGCSAYPPPKDDGLGVQNGAPAPGARPQLISAVSQAEPLRFVTVSGIVRTAQGTAALVDVTSPGDASSEAQAAAATRYEAVKKAKSSGFRLQLEGPGGEKLDRVLADVDPPAHEEEAPSAFAFADLVEAPFTPVAVRILKGDTVLAERKASAAAPTVKVVSPNGGEKLAGAVDIRWQASDPDNDKLVFDIAYSPDGGADWKVITMGATGTSLRIPAADLEASKTGVFRVTARDGFRTASDVSDGAFEAPDGPPSVALVLNPNDGRTFRLGDLVVLQGTASDLTEGLVADLAWNSDKDGALGTGSEVQTRNLSAGPHRITLTATDKAGGTAEMSIGLTIDATQLADVPDAAELAKLETRLKAAPAAATGSRSGDEADDSSGSTAVAAIGLALVLAALAVAVVLVRRRRRNHPSVPE
ncbi:MAG: hypothetical protein ACR2MO_14620 [Acidimicrobiales bacterium]